MRRIILLALAVSVCGIAPGQQPRKVTEKWFPDPAGVEMDIPAFNKKSGFTSYAEMMRYLDDMISRHPQLISMEMIGKTQKGRDIPLLTVRKQDGRQDKLRMFYTARIHGNEPSGTEALLHFIAQLAKDKDVNILLDKMDFYIMPMINVDGAEKDDRYTANTIDLNRDMSKLDTPEAAAYHAGSNIARQDISVDFHEYQPVKAVYPDVYSKGLISVPWDIMFLFSGNPNVPVSIRDAVNDLFLPNLRRAMDINSLTHHTYFTPSEDSRGVIFTIGGSSPRSTSNAMALKNSISLLMETRGINLGKTSALRRTNSAYLAALDIARTAYDNEDLVRRTIAEAEADRSDIAVKFSSPKNGSYPMRFIDLQKNDTLTINVRASLSYMPEATVKTPLPSSYYILPSETRALDVLSKIGVETIVLEEPKTATVQYYVVTESVTDKDAVGGVLPVTVRTKTGVRDVVFPAGTIVVPTAQRNVRAATVLLEPESSNGFVNYKVIDSANNEELPIYKEL